MSTEGGLVEGVNKRLGLFGDFIDIFKGIPFGAPTKILENPQPHPGWPGKTRILDLRSLSSTLGSSFLCEFGGLGAQQAVVSFLLGTLQATEYKPRCMQATLTQTDVRGSLDCLYLNIWVPQGKKQGMGLMRT